jgi:hypothetical protein
MLNRRTILKGIALSSASVFGTPYLNPGSAKASPAHDLAKCRVQVIDMSTDSTPHLEKIKKAGIKVIGRYYSRAPDNYKGAPDCGYPDKVLTQAELDAIEKAGLGVVAVFQHCNQCNGFNDPKGKVDFSNKGTLDARAALASAHALGQPRGTPVYFGIDFNPKFDGGGRAECNGKIFPSDEALLKAIATYFQQINDVFRPANLRVGVYGGGAICRYLMATQYGGKPLAEYFWLAASIGFKGHSEFYESRKWHLYQNKIEIPRIDYITGLTIDQNIDTDVTNPQLGYFGQWQRGAMGAKAPGVSVEDAKAIIASRGFYPIATRKAFARRQATGKLEGAVNMPGTGHTFRIIERFPATGAAGESLAVNFLEGEKIGGYFYAKDVTLGIDHDKMPA